VLLVTRKRGFVAGLLLVVVREDRSEDVNVCRGRCAVVLVSTSSSEERSLISSVTTGKFLAGGVLHAGRHLPSQEPES